MAKILELRDWFQSLSEPLQILTAIMFFVVVFTVSTILFYIKEAFSE